MSRNKSFKTLLKGKTDRETEREIDREREALIGVIEVSSWIRESRMGPLLL
jgi:hypothetical protein